MISIQMIKRGCDTIDIPKFRCSIGYCIGSMLSCPSLVRLHRCNGKEIYACNIDEEIEIYIDVSRLS
jgi:hypothetical protein